METTLTEKQQIRAALADKLGYDLSKAKSAYEFIMNYDKAIITPNPTFKPDGTYYVMRDHTLVSADEETAKTYRDAIIGVAVKMGDKVTTVALHDAADGEEIALTKGDKCGSQKFFKSDFWDAISDYDGEANTKDYGDALNPEINLQPGQYIPSCGQLHLILLNIKAVNQALEAVGGTPLRKEWYWSSTEHSASHSWFVLFGHGGSLSNGKFYTYVVRPAVACQL